MSMLERIFGGNNQQAQQQQKQEVQQQQQTDPHVAANPTVPNAGNVPPAEVGPDGKPIAQSSPTDQFKSLWQNDPNLKPNSAAAPLINIDQKLLAENVQKMNFSKQIDPNLFQVVLGEDKAAAAQAFASIINSVGQQATAQALLGNSMITENAVKTYGNTIRSEIPEFIKQQSLREGMQELNPALSDPAYAPMVQAVQQRMQEKFPQANTSELQKLTSDYFDDFAKRINQPREKQQQQQQQAANKDVDWGDFLSMPTSLDKF